jgi:inorganic pyrophosphatase
MAAPPPTDLPPTDPPSGDSPADPPLAGAPDDLVEVIVEIPRGSRNKYEIDHHTGAVWLDRRLFSATVYPSDYGFVPDTLAEDGDPLDVLVLLEDPTFPGCHLHARPLGVMWMTDDAGPDAKIIAVHPSEQRYAGADDISDLPPHLLEEIEHFFHVYKQLEPDKFASTRGFEGRDAAWSEIRASQERFRAG